MLNLVYTLCSSAMFVRIVLGVGNRQVFCVWCFFARKHGLVQARRPHVTVVVLTLALLGRGGGGGGTARGRFALGITRGTAGRGRGSTP